MKNNDIYFDENPKINDNQLKSDLNKENDYKNIFLCPLNRNDCVNSIDIIDDIILYGTIMGNVYLCRVNQNNLYQNKTQDSKKNNNPFDFNNSKISNKNETQYEIKLKYKIEEKESSRISCIKLNTNNNLDNNNNNFNQYNENETLRTNNEDKKDKIFYDSDIVISPKTGQNNHEISTKRKLLNAIENKNNKSDKIMIDNDSTKKYIDSSIPFPQVTQLILNAAENVPCVSFDTKDKVNISIGDYEIIRLENMSTFNINDDNSNYNYFRIRNYSSENEHIKNCENATCMMTDKNFLILFTNFGENCSPITSQNIRYENKQISSFGVIKGEIEMYNFSIPFDFDGDRFLFLDYESDNIRRICIYYTEKKYPPYIFKINNNFGHINYMKFLLNDKIIICKNQKYCEIHKIDENFVLLDEWEHNGNEIIAMNIYIQGSKDTEEYSDDSNTNLSIKKYDDNDSQTIEINLKKINNHRNKNVFNENEHYFTLSPLNNKRKPYEKEKFNNSSLRELKNKKFEKKNLKFDKVNQNFEYNYNLEINNLKNKFENGNKVEIYNKNKIPPIKEANSANEYKKIKLSKIVYDDSNINNYKSDKELIDKDRSFSQYIQDKNNPTERSLYQNENKIYIITVDIKGNINIYHNKKRKTIFNLYDIKNIDNEYKQKEFFSYGFPYYVIMNNKYYAISTDHGIFVLSNKI